ncbi:MAG: NAD-dependent epimerase/dehydratase family protein [Candidatus Woesearchaeota archaeon]
MVEKVLITGGSGFIGYNLAVFLKELGKEVSVLSRSENEHLNGIVDKYYVGDVMDHDSVQSASSGQDVVFHLAAKTLTNTTSPEEMMSISAVGTSNVLSSSKISGVRRVVLASSQICAGFSTYDKPLSEDSILEVTSRRHYLNSKLLLEKLGQRYSSSLEVCIARMSRVYGAGDYSGQNSVMIRQLQNHKVLPLLPGSTSVVSVSDCVSALEMLSHENVPVGVYHVSDDNVLLSDLYKQFSECLKTKNCFVSIPCARQLGNLFLFLLGDLINDRSYELVLSGISNKVLSNEKIKSFGWSPVVSFHEAVNQQIKFYFENKLI